MRRRGDNVRAAEPRTHRPHPVLTIRPRSLKTLVARVSLFAFALLALSVAVGTLVVRYTYLTLETSLADRVGLWVRGTLQEQGHAALSTAEGRAYSEAAIALARTPKNADLQRRFTTEHIAVLDRRNYAALVLFDRDGRAVYAWTRIGVVPPPTTLPRAIFTLLDTATTFGGFLRWGHEIYRVGGAQLRGDDGIAAGGYAVIGAPVNDAYLADLHRPIALPMRLTLDSVRADAPARHPAGDSIIVFEPLRDVLGAPLGTLRAPVDRHQEQHRFALGLVVLGLVLVGGALTAWAAWFYGKRLLLEPLEQTVRDVEAMRGMHRIRELSLDLNVQEWEILRAAFNETVRSLEEFQRRYRDVFDQTPDPLFLLEPATMLVIDANPATVLLTGVSAAEMLGRPFPPGLLPPGARQQVVRWRRPDGATLTWSVSQREMEFQGGAWTLVSFRDLTGREALAQAQKMEAVDLLAGGIAHDFNNLLGAVLTGTSAARALTGPGHPATAALDGIQHAGTRAAELTRQLLRFSRHDPMRLAPVDVGRAAEAVRAICERTFDRRITIVTATESHTPLILGDAGEIEQALLNLCINARDAMPNGGTLRLAVGRRVVTDAQVTEAGVQTAGTYVELSVSDTGTGMTDEVKARVFEPFFTTKEPGKGTGLGLPIVYGLVRQLGGAISLQSAPGDGARVTLLLPALSDRDAGSTPATPSIVSAADLPLRPSRRRSLDAERPLVLLVDDEPTLREMLRLVLDLSGYDVVEASDGAQAVAEFEAQRNRVRVVLLDVQMPGPVSGVEALAKLRALDAGIPVLLCTGFVREDEMARLRMLSVDRVLLKPLDLHALIERLDELTDSATVAES